MAELIGLDVHGDRGDQNWGAWRKAGVAFVFVKATEGATFTDSRFVSARVRSIEDSGLIFAGPYHFSFPENARDWRAEADHYLTVCDRAKVDWNRCFPVLDQEKNPGGVDLEDWVHNWCEYVERETGRDRHRVPGLVYTGYYHYPRTSVAPKGWELWRPWYGRASDEWPPADPWNRVLIWQDSETAVFDGIPGRWDRNRFRGTKQELKRLLEGKRGKGA